MANRAYLFFSDSPIPKELPSDQEQYYDSRHNIPFTWWLFFEKGDLYPLPERMGSSEWNEPCLMVPWEQAKAIFHRRTDLMNHLLNGKFKVHFETGRPSGFEAAAEIAQREAGVHDVLHEDHVMSVRSTSRSLTRRTTPDVRVLEP